MKIEKTALATYDGVNVDGALVVFGGGGFRRNILVIDTTDTSSINSGSIVTYGGVGITKNLYVGGTIYKNTMDNILFTNDWYCIYYYDSEWNPIPNPNSITVIMKSSDGSTVIMHNTGTSYTTELINYNALTTGRIIAFDTYTESISFTSIMTSIPTMTTYKTIEQTIIPIFNTGPSTKILRSITFDKIYYDNTGTVTTEKTILNIYVGLNSSGTLIYSAPIVLPNAEESKMFTIYGAVPMTSNTTYTLQIFIPSANATKIKMNLADMDPRPPDQIVDTLRYNNEISGDDVTTTTESLMFNISFGETPHGRQIFVNRTIAGTGYEINTSVASSLSQIINFETTQLVTPQTVPPLFGTTSYDSSTDTNKIVYLNESVVVTSTIQSASTNTGALTIIGGAGIGGALYVGSLYLPTVGGTPASLSYYAADTMDVDWKYDNASLTPPVIPTPNVYYSICGNGTQKTVTLDFNSVSYPTSVSSNFFLVLAAPLYVPKQSKSFPIEVSKDGTAINTGWVTIDTSGNINVYYSYPNGVFTPIPTTSVGFSSFSITYIAHT